MKAINRKSLLPQPNARPFDPTAQHSTSVAGDQEARDNAKPSNKVPAPAPPSRLERPLSRIGDVAASSSRPMSRQIVDDRRRSHDTTRPMSSSASIPKRMSSIRPTSTHHKSTSNSGVEQNAPAHRSNTSRELKTPSATTRLARSGTLTRTNSQLKADSKLPSARNATNTPQQGQVPAKSALPKLAVAIPVRSGSIAVPEESISDDTSRVQIELLQLFVLHEEACKAFASYQSSARKKLGERHSYLQDMLREVIVLEQRRAKEVNLDVLVRWLPDPADLIEKLQIMSSIYHETLAITSDGSEFNKTMLRFQDWVLQAEECIQLDREESITPLPETWRHAHASTALSVRSLQRQLAQLPTPEKSSLSVLMKTCGALLDATLRELDMMTKLEVTLLEMDRLRIDNAIAASGCQDRVMDLPEPIPLCWQRAS